ncbi:methyltransferase domain-containing protein [Flavobacterium sp. PL002]|uniref:methyltransferase domain-containing protein n=1 Tax=Flavobacterium sp. PL002 TaxID=1897058 RepID=UPI00178887F2|nr:methyltransferase domain-containing protein [Flavobacterium sp. PL002]MBE0391562.1 Thiopurine S-methyltransferase [Flavobacterium sp. PL002]
MNNKQCCTESSDKVLDQNYWDGQYKANTTGWDLGVISPPLKAYIDAIEDKNRAILIPGCGNTYEAAYLLEMGFTNITVIDIAPTLIRILQQKFATNNNIQIVLGDFFKHQGSYDLIIEQTFFCALPPTMRQEYVAKMHDLLAKNGKLAGVLFNRTFTAGPPFGGSQEEYKLLFKDAFEVLTMDVSKNSITPRANTELFIELKKMDATNVNLYKLEGIITNDSTSAVVSKLEKLESVLNVSINTDYTILLLVSTNEFPLSDLQEVLSYDNNLKINKI